jgi:glycosyltransferase involved in cell wall biosynthesis
VAGTVKATVLIPTHDHGETLRYSVASALAQSVKDIEVFIIGDGVSDATRSFIAGLVSGDARLSFLDRAKAPSRGEVYRHEVLASAKGDIVRYLCDDDLWLPDHIETMVDLLREADLVLSMPMIVGVDGVVDAAIPEPLASPRP